MSERVLVDRLDGIGALGQARVFSSKCINPLWKIGHNFIQRHSLGLEDLWLHRHLKLIALGVFHIVEVERSQQTLSLLTFNYHFVHYIQLLFQDADMNLEILHQVTLATTFITIHWEAL